MLKKVIAVVLIVLAASAWLYLDHLNTQTQQQAEQARQEMIQARAEAAARAAAQNRSGAE
jgi:type II secretory pathway pseudopilin PulG